jgi:Aldo/keto reductases, related to diketogulonate reductase
MDVDDTNVIRTALDIGYRHVDTARIYHNKATVGAGLGGVDRDRLTVATNGATV